MLAIVGDIAITQRKLHVQQRSTPFLGFSLGRCCCSRIGASFPNFVSITAHLACWPIEVTRQSVDSHTLVKARVAGKSDILKSQILLGNVWITHQEHLVLPTFSDHLVPIEWSSVFPREEFHVFFCTPISRTAILNPTIEVIFCISCSGLLSVSLMFISLMPRHWFRLVTTIRRL